MPRRAAAAAELRADDAASATTRPPGTRRSASTWAAPAKPAPITAAVVSPGAAKSQPYYRLAIDGRRPRGAAGEEDRVERGVYFDAWFPRQHNYHPSLPARRLRMVEQLREYRTT